MTWKCVTQPTLRHDRQVMQRCTQASPLATYYEVVKKNETEEEKERNW